MDGKLLAKGVCIGLSILGGIGTVGVTMFDVADSVNELKTLKKTSLDVTDVPTVEVKEA